LVLEEEVRDGPGSRGRGAAVTTGLACLIL